MSGGEEFHAFYRIYGGPRGAGSSLPYAGDLERSHLFLRGIQQLGPGIKLWWDSLERLEITSDRCRVRLPLCDLVWAESTRRGSLVHSTQGPIATRETLTALEERLPKELFLRCQRGFLVNLRHVRRLDSGGLHMSDGAVVPLSRSSRGETAEAYRKFCLLWDVRMRDGEKRHG